MMRLVTCLVVVVLLFGCASTGTENTELRRALVETAIARAIMSTSEPEATARALVAVAQQAEDPEAIRPLIYARLGDDLLPSEVILLERFAGIAAEKAQLGQLPQWLESVEYAAQSVVDYHEMRAQQ